MSRLPNVSRVITRWFQNITLGVVTRVNNDGEWIETINQISTRGVVQPFSVENNEISAEGVRFWEYLQIHCLPELNLSVDEYIFYKEKRFKVMGRKDYSEYGYYEYQAKEAFV